MKKHFELEEKISKLKEIFPYSEACREFAQHLDQLPFQFLEDLSKIILEFSRGK